jgi:hypothetical protein
VICIAVPVVLYGQITWTAHSIADDFTGAISIYPVDLDGDTDLDVVGAWIDIHQIAWWESDLVGIQEDNHGWLKPDINGASVLCEQLRLDRNAHCRCIDIAGRPVGAVVTQAGVYFIEHNGRIVRKVIVVK